MTYKKVIQAFTDPFKALQNRVFATLYFAQTVSLLGDAFTWVGLALLSYQFGNERSALILSFRPYPSGNCIYYILSIRRCFGGPD